MPTKTKTKAEIADIIKRIELISGENIYKCYQCGKCTAGCVMAGEMDISPYKVIRMIQLGLVEKALESESMWLCAACFACRERCPKEVDLSKIMEALRVIQVRDGKPLIEPEEVADEVIEEMPQQGIVSAFRKYN
ncbi:MAG: heterodisulfide reductase [Alkaliphilus sp.]|nr:MAG: heterodisulfide reductase [Alkaliphilus sp.]